MQQGYFSRSWEAFRSTEGWFAKICVLALVAFIPILGPIVVSGYLLGWARDAAWGMDNPLPRKVFGNEDGRLYRRGLFAWIISLVMGLAVFVVVFVCMSLFGLAAGVFSTLFDGAYAAGFLAIPATIRLFRHRRGISCRFVRGAILYLDRMHANEHLRHAERGFSNRADLVDD